jgi:hypothetical protein
VREERREGFTDDWAAVAAELQTQMSSRASRHATPRVPSQTPSHRHIGALAGTPANLFDSQETVTSFDFSQTSATRLLNFLDSDPLSPDSTQEAAVGLTLDSTVSPTPSQRLSLSLEDLEPPEEATVRSEPWDME